MTRSWSAASEALTADLDNARFRGGEQSGRWRLVDVKQDTVLIAVQARPVPGSPTWFDFRLTVDSYPMIAPAGCLWDPRRMSPLDPQLWPRGSDASRVFNSQWNPSSIYLPCDRVAQQGHDGWRAQDPGQWWTPNSELADYCSALWKVLNGSGYAGIDTRSLRITPVLWTAAVAELRGRGRLERESGGFLLAAKTDPSRIVKFVPFDDLDPLCLTGAIHFRASGYSVLWDLAEKEALTVVADIHTHPDDDVRQSITDQQNPMIDRDGHIAIIAPHFAAGEVELANCGVFQHLGERRWISIPLDSRPRVIEVGE